METAELADIDTRQEWLTCAESLPYFVHTYCRIYDAPAGDWIAFHLWAGQFEMLRTLEAERLVVMLKARQLGMSWLVLCFALWLMLFHPAATVLLFSRRDDESVHLLDYRLKGVYRRLPRWMQARSITKDNEHVFELSNGSAARAFPTTAGDSYTASLAIVDEADLVPNLGDLMRAVKPTIDGGGRMVLLSRPDKTEPESEFKAVYRGAKDEASGSPWASVFLPWNARPDRDAAWYEEQKRDIVSRTGSLDDLHEQYPATDSEALTPKSLNKRIPAEWLLACYQERQAIPVASLPKGSPSIPELRVYRLPEPGRVYVIGADPAEGNPTSDNSSLTVLDALSGEEVAKLTGKFQPSTLASHADVVGAWFNQAAILPERNNHGHAVILWLRDNSKLRVLLGFDLRPGWLSSSKGKSLLYDAMADACRDHETTIHSFDSFTQLASIEGATLRAPNGQNDDEADSYALAILGTVRVLKPKPVHRSYQG